VNENEAHIEGLVPFVHVRDVVKSAEFYERFGFEIRNTYDVDGRRVWCWLELNQARIMLAETEEPVPAGQQFVLFYLYVHDLHGLHEQLTRAGLEPGPIEPGHPGLEFSIDDPDGYNLMVTDAGALAPLAR
jgi:predicted enzyme related to lactoylglutathione lyase